MIGIDTNVILNILRKDDPFLHKKGSLEFFKCVMEKRMELAVSAITVTELFRKPFKNKSIEEQECVDAFLHFIKAQTIPIEYDSAVESARLIEEISTNFADALIAASMLFGGIKIFVTRNVKDYVRTGLEIMTPEEFLNKYR